MTAITLPADLQAWAEAEVAAGRAESVEQIVVKAVAGYRRALEAFRKSLDDAATEVLGGDGIDIDEAFDYIDRRIEARAAFEEQWSRAAKRA